MSSDALDRIEAALTIAIGTHGEICQPGFCPVKPVLRDAQTAVAELRSARKQYDEIMSDNEDYEKQLEQLRTQMDGAENAIRHCDALKDWSPSTSEYLASRVTFLCNLHSDTVNTLGSIADERDQLRAQLAEALAVLRNLSQYQAVEGHLDGDKLLVGLAYHGSEWGPVADPTYEMYELAEAVEKWLKDKYTAVLAKHKIT